MAIAPIDYSDVIPHHTRAAVRATVGDTLREIARDSLLLDVDAECRPRECALRQARDAEAEFLLDMRVTLADRDYAIAIVVLAADDGRELARADGLCRLCAQAELLAEIATQVATLEATLGPEPVEPPVVPNRTFDRLDHATTPRPGMKIAGWVSFTLGLAGIGAGAALIAIDGRDHQPTCGVDVRDIQGGCPNVYTTRVAGLVGVGLGGAALVTGVGLVIGSKRDREVSAWIGPAPGGLQMRF